MLRISTFKSSRLRRGEVQNVLLRMGEATRLLNLQEEGLGAAKVKDFKASVENLSLLMQKDRSTNPMSMALNEVDIENKQLVTYLVKTVTVNVFNLDQEIAQAAVEVLQAIDKRADFFVGTREYRYNRLDIFIAALDRLDKDTLKKSGIFGFYNAIKEGRDKFYALWEKRCDFRKTFTKDEVKNAIDVALTAYNNLIDFLNGKVMFTGNDDDVADFFARAQEIISEINTKIAARSNGKTISEQEDEVMES